MKSIQTKVLTVVISVILLIALTTTIISFVYTRKILEKDADIITESVARAESFKINQELRDVEYTVDAMKNYVLSTIGDMNEIKNKSYRENYNVMVSDAFFASAGNLNGNLAFYIRYDSEISNNQADGFYYARTSANADFAGIALSGVDKWEASPWYSVPKTTGAAAWLQPYYIPAFGCHIISYVVPIYIEHQFVAVIGVDFNFTVIEELVTNVSVYDNGFAYLSDSAGETVYFSPVDDHVLNRAHTHHGFAEEHMVLDNGMTLVIHADYSDIQRESYRMTILIIIAVVLLLIIFLLITWILTKRITSPLKKLTAAAEMLADGNVEINLEDCKTQDEVGILAVAFEKTSEKLRGYMKYINALAYKDALTGIKNRTAYNEVATEIDVKIKLGECAPFAVVVADVNGLKVTNDKYGHEVGNKLLIKISKVICDIFKHSPVFRIGGDEFVVVLNGEDFEVHTRLMCELDNKLKDAYISVGDVELSVSAARAVAVYDKDKDASFDDVFNRADKKMYEHKMMLKNKLAKK